MTVPHHSEPAREAVALVDNPLANKIATVIEDALARHGVDASDIEGTLDDAGDVLALVSASPAGGLETVREIEAIFRRHLQANDYAKDLIKRIAFDVVPAVRKALSAALASPAATSAENLEAVRVMECPATELGIISPAATSAETQGDAGLPARIWVERDEETNEKRWFTIRGMGAEYVRADLYEALARDLAVTFEDAKAYAEIAKQNRLRAENAEARIAALAPSTSAATRGEPHCTDCGGTGVTYQTERRCSCQPPPAPAVESAQVKAWGDVLDERRRQVEAEGWTPAHDDEHDKGEMAGAAAVYALHDATYKPWQPPEPKGFEAVREAREEASKSLGTLKSALASMRAKNPAPPRGWPWHIDWWKPASRRRNLVKAGALILAEIERLDRASLAADAEG